MDLANKPPKLSFDTHPRSSLIVALDFDSLSSALKFAKKIADLVGMFKIGSQLFTAAGPDAVRQVAALGAGGHHRRHADNCRQNKQGDWVANHTPHRDVSAIYYLNDAFEGGEIVFDRAHLVVKARRGLLLAFPSDADHVHEILPVRSGARYTMPIWFTKQQRYALADFSVGMSPIGAAVRAPG